MGALLGLVLIGHLALVAAAWIPAPHSGGDNAAYVALADALLDGRGYTEVWDPAAPPHTKYPPVFPLLLAGMMALGAHTWTALKLAAAASTTAAVALAFLWTRRRGHGPLFAAGVAGILAVAVALVDASHWILSDPTFVALTLLALWALARGGGSDARTASGGEAAGTGSGSGEAPGPGAARASAAWLAVGCAAAVLAYFTRSAGLPLLLAVAAWLALDRRWKALAAFAAAAGAPALLWWLRARAVPVAEGAYGSEFWLRDPYAPEAGRVGVGDLMGRAVENGAGYVTRWIPGSVVGQGGGWVAALGLVLVGLAVAGWVRRLRPRPGPAELFTPLYLGLVLVWPAVWSGERFALPLLPILLVYAGEALAGAASRLGRGGPALAGAVAVALLGFPAVVAGADAARRASACEAAVARGGAWACWGPRFGEIVAAARWSAVALPEGSAVLSRKPRVFYAVSGVPSRTYPFTDDPDALLAAADAAGARYVLLDFFGRQGPTYVAGALSRRPGAFCVVRAFELAGGGGLGAQLLGILPPEERREGGGAQDGELRVRVCPDAYVARRPEAELSPPGPEIPLRDFR